MKLYLYFCTGELIKEAAEITTTSSMNEKEVLSGDIPCLLFNEGILAKYIQE